MVKPKQCSQRVSAAHVLRQVDGSGEHHVTSPNRLGANRLYDASVRTSPHGWMRDPKAPAFHLISERAFAPNQARGHAALRNAAAHQGDDYRVGRRCIWMVLRVIGLNETLHPAAARVEQLC